MSSAGLAPMLLITTTPVAHMRHGDSVVLVASNVGNAGDPQWFRNLLAGPVANLSIAGVTRTYAARVAHGHERERLTELYRANAPTFDSYREKAGRELPIVVLTPAADQGRPAASSRR